MLKSVRYLILLAIGVALSGVQTNAQVTVEPSTGTASFNVFYRSIPTGVERVSVLRAEDGWTVNSVGQLSPPFGVTSHGFEMKYDLDWNPQQLTMVGARQGRDFSIRSSFTDGVVMNQVRDLQGEESNEEPFERTSVVLADYFFGAYEGLAVRLNGTTVGDRIPVYVAPRGQADAVIVERLEQQLESAQARFSVQIYRVTFDHPAQPDAEVWVDANHRLLRVTQPDTGLDVVRQDLSLVSTRLTGVEVAGDADVRIPGAGFGLAATVTTPVNREEPHDGWPAVVLVPGSSSTDRDENLFGVPIFGQLAAGLADAGYLVLRYDRRGVGQSGGRPESATIDDYANDARAVIRYVDDRDDVDGDRIVLLAHSEGGWIGLRAASRDDKVAAVVLMATASVNGSAYVLEQQQLELERLGTPEQERNERTALQRRIHAAVLGEGTWGDVPDDIRRQADTPWFRSLLEFEPAEAIRRSRQPMLIIHGVQDEQVPPYHADRLKELAEERDRAESTVEVVKLEGVNHLMLRSEDSLTRATAAGAEISDDVTAALTSWMGRTLPAER